MNLLRHCPPHSPFPFAFGAWNGLVLSAEAWTVIAILCVVLFGCAVL